MPLNYITREASNPQGKPRVYFSAHPEDMPLLEDTAREILRTQNCAVYYDTAPGADASGEDLEPLAQMQLFVLPVTARFLSGASRARDRELPFALARHIPVLPLLWEPGLQERFDRICGTLQALETGAEDYREKLERHLNSVLVGDALAERIRGAFDARVFLSYRRADRQLVRELIRLIHRNELCRDVAIWYDGFLVPGEDFNDAISQALDHSGLVLLAVTPSLLEEDNYVMTAEYPAAAARGKPILPVELADTDRAALERVYPGIPRCVPPAEDGGLSGALLDALKALTPPERDGGPEHDYLIGLAYLNGVDVEVDHARAAALITGAAEAGLIEAAARLVDMYRTGNGVEIDDRQSVRWRETLVELLRRRNARALEERGRVPKADEEEWLNAIVNLGHAYEFTYDMDGAERAYRRYLEGMEALVRRYEGDDVDRWHMGLADRKLGSLLMQCGRLSEAEEYMQGSFEIFRSLYQKYENRTMYARGFADCCLYLGHLRRNQGRLGEAEADYQRCMELRQKLWKATGSFDDAESLAESRVCLGVLQMTAQKPEAALSQFERCLELRQRIYGQSGDKRLLAYAHSNMGQALEALGRPAEAELHYIDALKIYRRAAEEGQSASAASNLASGLMDLGDLYKNAGYPDRAEPFYLEALPLYERLAEESGALKLRKKLALAYERMGLLLMEKNDWDGSARYLEEELALRRQIREASEAPSVMKELSAVLMNLGIIHSYRNSPDRARACCLEALSLARRHYEETGDVGTLEDMARIWLNLARCSPAEEAKAPLLEALNIIVPLWERNRLPQYVKLFAECEFDLGRLLHQSNPPEAREHYQRSISLYRDAWEKTPTPAWGSGLQQAYGNLAVLEWTAENWSGAAESYLAYSKVGERMWKGLEMPESERLKIAVGYSRAANAFMSLGRMDEVARALRRHLELTAETYQRNPTPENGLSLAAAYRNSAFFPPREGGPNRALLAQALPLLEWLAEVWPENEQAAGLLAEAREILGGETT